MEIPNFEGERIYLITESNLIQLVERIDAIRESRRLSDHTDSDKFLTKKEVMNILKVSSTKVWRLTKEGKLPAFSLGSSRSLRYRLSDVLKFKEK